MAKERYVMFRLSEDDYAMAERAAKELGLRTSTFARMTLLQASRKSVPAQVKPEVPTKLNAMQMRLQADEGKWEARDGRRTIDMQLYWSRKSQLFYVAWYYRGTSPADMLTQRAVRPATAEEIALYGPKARAEPGYGVPMDPEIGEDDGFEEDDDSDDAGPRG